MKITLLTFGNIAEIIPSGAIETAGNSTAESVINELIQRHPALTGLPFRLAVNEQFTDASAPLQHNDTLALLPPFSGG